MSEYTREALRLERQVSRTGALKVPERWDWRGLTREHLTMLREALAHAPEHVQIEVLYGRVFDELREDESA